MSDKIEDIKPTRMELLEIRKKKMLAKNGHKLLTEKRDALISEFFKVVDQRKKLRNKLTENLKDAYESLMYAELVVGKKNIMSIAEAIPAEDTIITSTKNIMGVRTPNMKCDGLKNGPYYGFGETSAELDEATMNFRKLLLDIVNLGDVEGKLESLGKEIEKTKRRVNALENIFIPKFEATEKYTRMVLEEREREDFFRRKRIKAIMEAKENAS